MTSDFPSPPSFDPESAPADDLTGGSAPAEGEPDAAPADGATETRRRVRAPRAPRTPRPSRAKAAAADPGPSDPGLSDPGPAESPSTEDSAPPQEPTSEVGDPAVLGETVEVPGALDESVVDIDVVEPVPAAIPAAALRRRRRRRGADLEPEVALDVEPPALETPPDPDAPETAGPDGDAATPDEAGTADHLDLVADLDLDLAEDGAAEAAEAALAAVTDGDDADGDNADGEDADGDEPAVGEEAAEHGAAEEDGRGRRRRRRGGRGRGRRGREGTAEDDGAPANGGPVDSTTEAPAETDTDADAGDDHATDDADDDADGQLTRLTARARRGRGRGRAVSAGRGRQAGRPGRAPFGGLSEETRRAIVDGPPKRMLVTVGAERTQVVVLEERDLVEHYVTRRQDVSYVGNIYLGRVQNVLPGMEAAFVDIGKGRNGVLYAGEVNYDEADLDGELPRIEQTLKPGQTLLVQVTKDPMGTKGARLTQQLSLAGRYCVLAPGDGMLGISRKLDEDERERLRKLLKAIKPEHYGLIVRTAAEGATREQLEADVARLVRIWEQVEARAAEAQPLDSVYEEPGLVIRVIRDVFGPEFVDLVADDAVLAEQVRGYLSEVSPELVDRVHVQQGEEPLFDGYEVTNQIRRALEKKVWLASGGYLIVEKTEAMWVIDVNTGKFVGTSNLEETVLRNNLEAAKEIARQLRLRDMGGIIVIDFVDMLVPANRDEVLKRFKRELARDKTKSRVMEISKLGLVQMTRKNVSQGLAESFTTVCDCCEGRGRQIAPAILG